MATTIVYDTLSSSSSAEFPTGGDYYAFSFTSSSLASGTLNGLTLALNDPYGSTDSGSVTVSLYSSATGYDSNPTLGTKLATLGTISDASFSGSTPVDVSVAVPPDISLASGTRYWVDVAGSTTSQTGVALEQGSAGTGAANEFFQVGGEFADGVGYSTYPDADNAAIAKVSENVGGSTTIAYDTTGQSSVGADVAASGTFTAFSITPTQSGSLSQVSLAMEDAGATTDGGSVTVGLYADNGGQPGTLVATVGTIADSAMGKSSPTTISLTAPSGVSLQGNTTYWVELNGSPTSGASVAGGTSSMDIGATGTVEYNSPYVVFDGDSSSAGFQTSQDSSSAVLAEVEEITCFGSGTLIRTVRGQTVADVAVEHLRVGDLAVTSSGEHRPIRWLGHRAMDPRRHPRPSEAMPVRIAAHAFGPGRPARDLYVSPAHAIGVDVVGEVLIPASSLLNGSTIRQVEVDTVTYWHVELDSHDLLLAEHLPAESYIDMGNRAFFAEGDVVAFDLSPDVDVVRRTTADFCRPFHTDGAVVDAVRERLAARATSLGWTIDASDPFAGLHLVADGARIDPVTRGLSARFIVPAGACDVWLVSDTTRPIDVDGGADRRDLGVPLAGLAIDDGFGPSRVVALDDPRFGDGFHPADRGDGAAWRWTAGRARLPAELWAGQADAFFLRIDLARPALPRWVMRDHRDRLALLVA